MAQRARADATLSVGEVKTTVTVEGAGATQVETGTLNVYPNVDAIAEFKVLTSNYGAQYGTTTSTRATSSRPTCPLIRKTIFGYTVGGPVWHGALPTVNAADIIGPLLYNAAAFAAPTGLTFGDAGRNLLNVPARYNFDTGLFKNFYVTEVKSFEFRAEAFNVFNHTQWSGVNSDISCYGGSNNSAGDASCLDQSFLHPNGAHLPRILQLALKLYF